MKILLYHREKRLGFHRMDKNVSALQNPNLLPKHKIFLTVTDSVLIYVYCTASSKYIIIIIK